MKSNFKDLKSRHIIPAQIFFIFNKSFDSTNINQSFAINFGNVVDIFGVKRYISLIMRHFNAHLSMLRIMAVLHLISMIVVLFRSRIKVFNWYFYNMCWHMKCVGHFVGNINVIWNFNFFNYWYFDFLDNCLFFNMMMMYCVNPFWEIVMLFLITVNRTKIKSYFFLYRKHLIRSSHRLSSPSPNTVNTYNDATTLMTVKTLKKRSWFK